MPFQIFYYENITEYYFLKHALKNKVFSQKKNRKKRHKEKEKKKGFFSCFQGFQSSFFFFL